MTKKNEKPKRLNQTAHQQAMKSPRTRAVLSALRERWEHMSAIQRGEQLIVLIGFKCSIRGIADELGRPEPTIRRYISLAKSSETGDAPTAKTKQAPTKGPLMQKRTGTGDVTGCKPSEIPAKKEALPIIAKIRHMKNDVQQSTTQQMKRNTSSPSTRAPERPLVNNVLSEKVGRPREQESKTRAVDLYVSMEESKLDKMRRLTEISIKARPIWNAKSMKPQGKPLPPKDPHGTGS